MLEQLNIDNLLDKAYLDYMYKIKAELEEKLKDSTKESAKMRKFYTIQSHQIKTPISAIKLIASEIGEERIKDEIFRVEEYIDLLLNYSRVNSDTTDYVFKRFSLDELLRKSIRKFSRIFISKKISLDYKETKKFIITDEKWFCFMIEQIISNALKYTSKGMIEIKVNGETVNRNGTCIV